MFKTFYLFGEIFLKNVQKLKWNYIKVFVSGITLNYFSVTIPDSERHVGKFLDTGVQAKIAGFGAMVSHKVYYSKPVNKVAQMYTCLK